MKKLCLIVANSGKKEVNSFLNQAISILKKYNFEPIVFLCSETSKKEELYEKVKKNLQQLVFIISLGGDGTLLYVARSIAKDKIPILPINLGTLGFVAENKKDDFEILINNFQENKTIIEKRMMINTIVKRNKKRIKSYDSLNDAVIGKSSFSRVVKLDVYVDNVFLSKYIADGLIISTPTGSTGYSLSASGPILNPSLEAIIINPICPHTLGIRPLIIRSDQKVSIFIRSHGLELSLTLDGQEYIPIEYGDDLEIKKSRYFTYLIKQPSSNFFDLVRTKFKWPE